MNVALRRTVVFLSAFPLFCTQVAGAYGTRTHQALSTRAAARSVLGGPEAIDFYGRYGWSGVDRFPGTDARLRSPQALVGFGAVQEDDQPGLRMRNHFFDPQNGGRPLTIGIALGYASPDWSLEDREPLPQHFFVPSMPEQKHSLRSAQRYLKEALTDAVPWSRRQKAGLLFQTLGQVIHHVQDMAQPEHVRNDQHISGVDTSYYEQWTDGNLLTLPMEGYATPDLRQFSTARRYWTQDGAGIADFTARNFVSKDTNFRVRPTQLLTDAKYPLPAVAPDVPVEKIRLSSLVGNLPFFLPDADVWFLGTQVTDVMRPAFSRLNPRASTFSIYMADLARFDAAGLMTLNRFNFAAAHQFLIPRAVAYSAGLIDYFFRGRLALDSFEAANGTATIKVRNVSAADFPLHGRSDGAWEEFSLYYDAQDGQRHKLTVANADLGTQPLGVGATRTLTFPVPADLAMDEGKPFMLVFDGMIGEEPGIAALALDAPPLQGFVLQPSYTPADQLDGPRLIQFENGGWKLSERTGLRAGNVDWKGSHPEDVLTWDGPASRYFFAPFVYGYSVNIYYGGRVLAAAPGVVLGAALRYSGTARELLAATYDGGQLHLYKRPFPAEPADDRLYHPQTNPTGWLELHASDVSPPRTPFFFNASATEGQTIAGTERVKLSIIGEAVERTAIPTSSQGMLSPMQQSAQMTSSFSTPVGEVAGPQQCPASRSEACEETAAIPCTGGPITLCVFSRLETDDRMASHSLWRREAYTESRPQTICVDYRGDTEILCAIEQPEAGLLEDLSLEKVRRQTAQTTRGGTCDDLATSSTFEEAMQRRGRTLISSVFRLKAGGLDIPLTGESLEKSGSLAANDRIENGQRHQTSAGQEVVLRSTYDSRLIYLDVRNDLALYEDFGTEERIEATVAGDTTAASGGVPAIRRTTVRSQIVAWIGGERLTPQPGETVSQQSILVGTLTSLADPHLGFSPQLGLSNLVLTGYSCAPFDNFSDSWTELAPQQVTGNRDWSTFIHPRALGGAGIQGYAVDSGGRVLVSQPLWKRTSGGAYATIGQWNFISGGRLDEIVPPATAGAGYQPAGVVR